MSGSNLKGNDCGACLHVNGGVPHRVGGGGELSAGFELRGAEDGSTVGLTLAARR